ncbi:MAG: hypothetical protein EB111_02330, partial [Actinobacteria bacterium]|nr:hypothetical protein [Actinomycetota bacterium]
AVVLLQRDRRVERSDAGVLHRVASCRGDVADGFDYLAEMFRRGAAAATDHRDTEVLHVMPVEFGQLRWCQVVVGLAVDDTRQAGVRKHADGDRGVLREVTQVLLHLCWASGAVDADDRRLHREQCRQCGANLGANQHASRGLHRHLHLDGNFATHRMHRAATALHRRLDLQQVHTCLDEQQINATLDEGPCVFFVGVAQLAERDVPEAWQLGAGADAAGHIGRCILNSANLEDGEEQGRRMDRVFNLARDYGAAVICLLIDERGQARDVEWKMQIAHRLHKIATERYGLSASDLIFDPLTFPLTTGDADLRRDGIESIEAIRRIKEEIPGALTVMGLSNVSFGINPAARQVLNSVFLDECVKAGLDAAIVHASKILPLARIKPEHVTLCRDIIFDKTTDDYNPLQVLLTAFEGVKSTKQEKPDRSGWPVRDRLRQRIIDGDREGLTAELDEALGTGLKALEIVNDVLLDGMREVGELFGSGQMQLPFVLQSAETMKTAVSHLEPHMDKVAGSTSKGKLVLATVKGDVHDIGKNLVDIICTNNGYEVHNIGIKIPISEMIAKVQEVGADALGMSGLLVKSTLIMRENLEELNGQGLAHIPVLLGGAALTRSYVERDLREVYEGRVFYGRDAFEGLHTLDKLMEIKRSGNDDPEFGRIPTGRSLAERRGPKETPVDLPRRSPDVVADNKVFVPPFLGSRVVKGISIDEIAEYVNETALFRNQWQYRPLEGENDDDFKARIRPELRAQLAEAKASGILVPQLVYGYFPANGDGNDVVIWTDDSRSKERMRFSYPRQNEAPFLCIADFFRPIESGEIDYAAFHIVTMGAKVSDAAAELFAKNEYQKYLVVHGLGVEMAEALAEFWHHRIRTEWGFVDEDGPSLHGLFRQQYRGGRYSWGYPACPDLEDNAKVAELLEAGRIGISVSEETGWQYQPEQTTSAIICHHPRAKYFVAR